ncbi:MAG: hypothetical protein HKO93_00340, partial [Flavobacteriales bacterium]|nr:hypothetical protein [Flavobacteriales bacterium]
MTNRFIPFTCGKIKDRVLVLSILLSVFSLDIRSQQFENSDLDGTAFSYSSLPDGWEEVQVGDPACFATNANIGDTPDLTNASNPGPENGVVGIAHSGNTFICGLRMNGPTVTFHEGIQQTLGGLVIGESYAIEFFQAVV